MRRAAVLIPALNEEASLGEVLAGLPPSLEAIVIDDASTDKTGEIALAANAAVLRHPRSGGYDAALVTGIQYCRRFRYDVCVTLDADGQMPPAIAGEVADRLLSGECDLVVGRRDRPERWSERVVSYCSSRYLGPRDILCGLKGYKLASFHSFDAHHMCGSIGTAMALFGLRAGLAWCEVPVPIRPRVGASRFGNGLRSHTRILQVMARIWSADAPRR